MIQHNPEGCHSNAVLRNKYIVGVWYSSFVTIASFLENYNLESYNGLIPSAINILFICIYI